MKTCVKQISGLKAESILEILLAVAIFAIVLPAILYTMGSLASSQPERNVFFDALVLTEDTKNTIQELKAANWEHVAPNGDYVLATVGGVDSLLPISITPTPDASGFMRTIQIVDVMRDNGVIVEQGGLVDGATKKIIISVAWNSSQVPVTTEFYVTRSDVFGAYSLTNTADFSAGSVLLGGTKVQSSGSGEDAEITLDSGDPETEIGLKSWWKMTGEYSTILAEIDAAPNGANNLQIFGAPTFATGRFNKKIVLNTNNKYLVASSSASLELTGQITILAWIKATLAQNDSAIVHKYSNANTGYKLEVDSAGKIKGRVGGGSVELVAQNNNISITDGLWHQTAMTYDGATLQVFVDGEQGQLAGSGVNVLSANTDPLYIGKNPNYTNRNFLGDIDDVQIYNTSLTNSEIKKLMYSTYTSTPKNFFRDTLFHSVGATVVQPQNTKVLLQVAMAEPISGSCESSYYEYVGHDSTDQTYFDAEQVGLTSITSVLPGTSEANSFFNPGQCLRWKAYYYSANDQGSDDPSLHDIRFTYSQ